MNYYDNNATMYQEGGPAPEEEVTQGAPQEGSGDPVADAIMQILQVAQQDPQAASQMALEFVMMLAQQMGLVGGAEGGAPEGTAPVFKAGGKLVRFAKKGTKMMNGDKMEEVKVDPKKAKMESRKPGSKNIPKKGIKK